VYTFKTITGEVQINDDLCITCQSKPCIEICIPQILVEKGGKVRLGIETSLAEKGKCIECLACELECATKGKGGLKIELPIPGLDEMLKEKRGM